MNLRTAAGAGRRCTAANRRLYAWLKSLTDRGVFFVTRARSNIDANVLEERAVPNGGNVVFDRCVALAGKRPQNMGMKPLRLVGYPATTLLHVRNATRRKARLYLIIPP